MGLPEPRLNNSIPTDGLKAKLDTQIICRANMPTPTSDETAQKIPPADHVDHRHVLKHWLDDGQAFT